MAWLFLIVVCGIAIYCNWNWCWQRMKFARGWVKYLRARINKKPATALLYMVWAVVIFLLWVFGPDLYELFRVLSYQIKYDGTSENGDSGIALRYFAFAVAAVGSLAGYFIAIVRNMIADNRNVIAQDKNRIIEQGRITESIGQAITQIGAFNDDKPNIEVRLGGLYSLQRIMQDSPRDTLSIAKIIFAYVRENAKRVRVKKEGLKYVPLPEDIDSVLNIINQFNKEWKKRFGELPNDSQLNFSGADFAEYDLVGVDFSNAILKYAYFTNANLSTANCTNADLSCTILYEAHLYNTNFTNANLSSAILVNATLPSAKLINANLLTTNFSGADLSGANLSCAHSAIADFSGANLSRADLYHTILAHAKLFGADLSEAHNLTQEQINEAEGDEDTKLPNNLIRPDSWKKTKNGKKT